MHLISLSLISSTRFGTLPHHRLALRISCCQTKQVVFARCISCRPYQGVVFQEFELSIPIDVQCFCLLCIYYFEIVNTLHHANILV